jgi:hypothetical protein
MLHAHEILTCPQTLWDKWNNNLEKNVCLPGSDLQVIQNGYAACKFR